MHVANHKKHFPGATLQESDGQRAGQKYIAANGSDIVNESEFGVPVLLGKSLRKSTFQNAQVGMPIFSLDNIAREQHRITLEDDHGTILHEPSGELYRFVAAMGSTS